MVSDLPDQIGRVLDLGAEGVIVPMVDTSEQAEQIVHACRYPPLGKRSFGPLRAMIRTPDYLATANDSVACIVMIETAEGLMNAEAIAGVEGIDALFVGPADLCLSLGLGISGLQSPEFTSALQRVLDSAARHGKVAGIFGVSPDMAVHALKMGFRFASIGPDTALLSSGIKGAIARVSDGLKA